MPDEVLEDIESLFGNVVSRGLELDEACCRRDEKVENLVDWCILGYIADDGRKRLENQVGVARPRFLTKLACCCVDNALKHLEISWKVDCERNARH